VRQLDEAVDLMLHQLRLKLRKGGACGARCQHCCACLTHGCFHAAEMCERYDALLKVLRGSDRGWGWKEHAPAPPHLHEAINDLTVSGHSRSAHRYSPRGLGGLRDNSRTDLGACVGSRVHCA
jgi:hypothetical protein